MSVPNEREVRPLANRFVLISGCSGGGKSTLLAELERRGHAVVEEPGRRIVAEEKAGSGSALPWADMAAFARRAVAMSRADLSNARDRGGLVFFDRGLVDAAVALEHSAGMPYRETIGSRRPYANPVFLAPPWPEIFTQDPDRRHGLTSAIEEFERLQAVFAGMNYDIQILPKTDVKQRADFVLDVVSQSE